MAKKAAKSVKNTDTKSAASPKKNSGVRRSSSSAPKAVPAPKGKAPLPILDQPRELVVLTGISGAGKLSALKAFEDLGFYSVDNLPLELIPRFADLVRGSREIRRAAIGVDIREGLIERFPSILKQVRKVLPTTVVYLEASDDVLVRRYSETRRPHPLGRGETVIRSIRSERTRLDPVRNVADLLIDTSKFNVHELRAHILQQFERGDQDRGLLISTTSFGFKNGVPTDSDLVFDVRFLPNPHFIPEFRPLTGQDARVADYVMNFPQTKEFLERVEQLLLFLLPHYVKEGKSYLTVAFGCTGGQHRSVAIAEEMKKRLAAHDYRANITHRDMLRLESAGKA